MTQITDQEHILEQFIQRKNLGPEGEKVLKHHRHVDNEIGAASNFAEAIDNLAPLINATPQQLSRLFNKYLLICELRDKADGLRLEIYKTLCEYYIKKIGSINFNQQEEAEKHIVILCSIDSEQLESNIETYLGSNYVRNLQLAHADIDRHIVAVATGLEGPQRSSFFQYQSIINAVCEHLTLALIFLGLVLGFVVMELFEIPFALIILPIGGLLLGQFVNNKWNEYKDRKNLDFNSERDAIVTDYKAQISALDNNFKAGINCKELITIPSNEHKPVGMGISFFSNKTAPEPEESNLESSSSLVACTS